MNHNLLSGEIQEGDSEALVEDFEKYALNYDYNDLVSIDDGPEEPGRDPRTARSELVRDFLKFFGPGP